MHAPLPAPKCPRPNPRICESTTFQGKRHFVDVIKALQMGDDPGLPSGLRYHKDPSLKEAGWGGEARGRHRWCGPEKEREDRCHTCGFEGGDHKPWNVGAL